MRNLFAVIALLVFTTFSLEAQQIRFGFEAGVGPTISPNTDHVFGNRATPRDEFTFNVNSTGSSIYLGAFAELDLNESFYLRAQALYNQRETSYKSTYTWETRERSNNEVILSEKQKQVDIPVLIGANLGAFDVNSGFVTHIKLSNSNNMDVVDGLTSNSKSVDFGWQSGVGLNISNIRLGLVYQMDFNSYGSHLAVNGTSLELKNNPTRLIATIGYKF